MSSPYTTPAVCEIDGCGVLAIGRCATCKRAFCPSHQGFFRDNFQQWVPQVNVCAACAEASSAEAAKQATEAQAPFWYFSDGVARAELLTSNVQSVPLYVIRQEWKVISKGFFRTDAGYVDDVMPAGRGWILGMFKWKYDKNRRGYGDSDYVVEECLTALRDTPGPQVSESKNHGLTYVRPCDGGYEDLSWGQNGDVFESAWTTGWGWREAMQAVKRLIEKPS